MTFTQDLGSLTGRYEVVEGFNGLYVYHESGYCTGAGDGSEYETMEEAVEDLVEFAKTEPSEFEAAYGHGGTMRFCDACEQWFSVYEGDGGVFCGPILKRDGSKIGGWLCTDCKADRETVLGSDGYAAYFVVKGISHGH